MKHGIQYFLFSIVSLSILSTASAQGEQSLTDLRRERIAIDRNIEIEMTRHQELFYKSPESGQVASQARVVDGLHDDLRVIDDKIARLEAAERSAMSTRVNILGEGNRLTLERASILKRLQELSPDAPEAASLKKKLSVLGKSFSELVIKARSAGLDTTALRTQFRNAGHATRTSRTGFLRGGGKVAAVLAAGIATTELISHPHSEAPTGEIADDTLVEVSF